MTLLIVCLDCCREATKLFLPRHSRALTCSAAALRSRMRRPLLRRLRQHWRRHLLQWKLLPQQSASPLGMKLL